MGSGCVEGQDGGQFSVIYHNNQQFACWIHGGIGRELVYLATCLELSTEQEISLNKFGTEGDLVLFFGMAFQRNFLWGPGFKRLGTFEETSAVQCPHCRHTFLSQICCNNWIQMSFVGGVP